MKEIRLDLNHLPNIPEIIHVSWKNKNILEKSHPLLDHGLHNIVRLNPAWKIEISDDQDIDEYLKFHLCRYDYLKIVHKKIVEKIDLWRLLKIYHEGGVYTDIDRLWNQSLDAILEPDARCVLPTFEDVDFSHSLMISAPGNPLYKRAIEDNLQKRSWLNLRGVFHLGPPLYMQSVTRSVFGKAVKRKPGKPLMHDYRTALKESDHFQTYREIHPFQTFTYQGDANKPAFDFEQAKADFYRQSQVKAWR